MPYLSATKRFEKRQSLQLLGDQITELAAHIDAAEYRFLVLLERFDRLRGFEADGMAASANWLNWKCGLSLGSAREKVRVAKALPELRKISEAFSHGKVSYSKVRAMTRVATPQNQDVLLNVALHGTAAHMERMVADYRKVKRAEDLQLENDRDAHRELTWYLDGDGYWVFKGRMTPEQGAIISRAFEAALDQLFDENENFTREPVARRRADALERVAEQFLVGGEGCRNGGDRYQLQIQVNESGASLETDGPANADVSAETLERMACDSSMVHIHEGQSGQPLSVGRKTRTIPPAIRRALKHRDGGCVFPGCGCTRFVDAHHVKHWAAGGETSMENLVLLCRRHHRLVHEGGFEVALIDGRASFRNPQGKSLPHAACGRFRGNAGAIVDQHKNMGLEITPKTPIPRWHGERMDRSQAVLGLLQKH